MTKPALSAKVAAALGVGRWASSEDVVSEIQRRAVDLAIRSRRLDPGLREWARSHFTAFEELVKTVPAGGLVQLARLRAAETGESLEEAQRAVVRHNPDLYSARVASRGVIDDERRRASIRNAASRTLAVLVEMEWERQGKRCSLDEARRLVFAAPVHAILVHQYTTGVADMPVGLPIGGRVDVSVPVKTETVPTAAEERAYTCWLFGLPANCTRSDLEKVSLQWGLPGGKGGGGKTYPAGADDIVTRPSPNGGN